MGGRCAEEIFVGDISCGAQQDIERATALARSMVCEWGMSDIMGAVTYSERSDSGQYLGWDDYQEKKYSEETAKSIDSEVKKILEAANLRALSILTENKEAVELMTEMLIEFETLDAEDVKKIISKEWTREDKKARLKLQDDLHKKPQATPPPPPPPPPGKSESKTALPKPA